MLGNSDTGTVKNPRLVTVGALEDNAEVAILPRDEARLEGRPSD